mmetsp:Transcript_40279/g.105798  ORF Transcript_40279/g.105798 Transcript_40279/m.105798 type:complete len:204 (-) Transcript_40279:13-624(-)
MPLRWPSGGRLLRLRWGHTAWILSHGRLSRTLHLTQLLGNLPRLSFGQFSLLLSLLQLCFQLLHLTTFGARLLLDCFQFLVEMLLFGLQFLGGLRRLVLEAGLLLLERPHLPVEELKHLLGVLFRLGNPMRERLPNLAVGRRQDHGLPWLNVTTHNGTGSLLLDIAHHIGGSSDRSVARWLPVAGTDSRYQQRHGSISADGGF